MKKLNLEQGTDEWLEWRRGLLTATDAAVLLGESPYDTPFTGWQRKCGYIPEKTKTAPMQRGIDDEPIARVLFIEEYGINMTPCCIESETNTFIGASLDGISDCGRYGLEVKSQRPVDEVPRLHWLQMQHQMSSSDKVMEKIFYVSHWEGRNITFEVVRDDEWEKSYIPQAFKYWSFVVFKESPPLLPKDYQDRTYDPEWSTAAQQYKEINAQIKALEKLKEGYREKLIELTGEQNAMGCGLKVLKKFTKGRIDYKEVVETQNVIFNEDHFRKPPSFSWTIMGE